MTFSLPSTPCLLKLPTDTALRTAYWPRLKHDKPHDSPSKVGTVWSRHHGSLFPINIQYPHFFSVVQSPFDNWHSSFSTTTFFEIAVYWSCFILQIDPSGWKGSVSNGLGADISLPHCLVTGFWNLAPKATSGPKSRGASFGWTLWRHVQRYCA